MNLSRWSALIFPVFAGLIFHSAFAADTAPQKSDKDVSIPTASAPPLPDNGIWLDEIPLKHYLQDFEIPRVNKSTYQNPLKVAGTVYSRGIGTHSLFEWMLDVKGEAESFEAWIGLDDETEMRGTIVFEVWADQRCAYRSEVIRCGEPVRRLTADLRGAQKVLLAVRTAGDGMGYDHGDWCNAYFVMKPGSTIKPEPIPIAVDPTPMPIATIDKNELGIFGPRVVGATPGKPFLFRIPASGKGKLSFSAKGLPKGLILDPDTGIITGALAEQGEFNVHLTVKARNGKAQRRLKIVAGQNVLAQTPPMGWNSWNAWLKNIDDTKIREAAAAMVDTGLAAKGYQYVNIDDGWVGERDGSGVIQSNEKFPDMKALTDYIHAKGLKAGIYSSPGPRTCCGFEGSYQHEASDAARYAEWGVDYLKYDWCSYFDLPFVGLKAPLEVLKEPYRIMGRALQASPRDIVLSMGQGGQGAPWLWGHGECGASLWRIETDLSDRWTVIPCIGMTALAINQYSGPGHWNDPDMLMVGVISWGTGVQHQTGLLLNEQLTHVTMWSMLAAPLLLGCDLTQLDPFTFNLIANPEVIDVDQDPLGKSAQRIQGDGSIEIWGKPLYDGTTAIALFNLSPWKQTIGVSPALFNAPAGTSLRDLWQRRDIAPLSSETRFEVAPHGAVLLKVGRPKAE